MSKCIGTTAAGKPCSYSAHPACAPYCRVHAASAAGAAAASAARAARIAEQERLLAAAAAEMAAARAPAFSSNELRAYNTLGIAPTRNAAAVRHAYHAKLLEPGVREAFTTTAGNATAARNRLEKIQAAYALLGGR